MKIRWTVCALHMEYHMVSLGRWRPASDIDAGCRMTTCGNFVNSPSMLSKINTLFQLRVSNHLQKATRFIHLVGFNSCSILIQYRYSSNYFIAWCVVFNSVPVSETLYSGKC